MSSGKPRSQRQLRVGELLRHALTEILLRDEIQDPRIDGRMITVSEVLVSPDLKQATAYVLPLGGENAGDTVKHLNNAAKFVRGRLSKSVDLKYTPQLRFAKDTSFDNSRSVDAILNSPEVLRDTLKADDESEMR